MISGIIEWNPHALEASLWLSLFAAPLGCFLIFRKLSFFGDALSHSSLTGVAVAYLSAGENPIFMSLGALGSVVATAVLLHILEKRSKLSSDLAMTASYSGMFALGVLLLSSSDVDLEHILFGDIWKITERMVWFLRVWTVIIFTLFVYFWRPFWASVLDSRFARTLGYNIDWIDFLFLIITSISIVGMIQSVGIVLVAAYLVLPPAAALPWARSLLNLVLGSIFFALVGSFVGVYCSRKFHLSAGPSIAVCAFLLFLGSQIISPLFRRNAHPLSN